MSEQKIRFDDGAGYEQMMGKWSRLAGDVFLDWLQAPAEKHWVDIGCGNGAFTELLIERCAPSAVSGIDPSEGQLAYARERPGCRLAVFQQGDAMSLPYAGGSFDAAVMALVIFFVPDPAKGVAEMSRVVKPGGLVSAYAWDMLGGGFPLAAIQAQMRVMGHIPMLPPSPEVSRKQALHETWVAAGLKAVETTEIKVQRTFDDFENYWQIAMVGSSVGPTIKALPAPDYEALKTSVQQGLEHGSKGGRIVVHARANAVRGFVPN